MPEEMLGHIRRRKEEIQEYADMELLDVIYGDEPPAPLTRSRVRKELAGLAASQGYYRGRVKVIRGLSEFHKLEEGDVLVIPYSDVSWTPMFTKAGAVVSASGGILSHSAIVAREYGIPAVVGVRDAMKLADNSLAVVDGFNGMVSIIG